MRRRWKILAGLVVLAVLGAWLLSRAPSPALRDLDNTRRALRREGFKLDLREFDFALPPELSRRRRLTQAAPPQAPHPGGPLHAVCPG